MAETNVGLDLGSNLIKVVELMKIGNNHFKILGNGTIASPPGGLLSESSLEHEAVSIAIKKIIKDAKITNSEVRVALPESQVFTFVIETPALSEKELASSIQWEAEQYIPIPIDEVVLDWKILVKGKNEGEKNQVLLVGAPKRVIEKYQHVLDRAGLTPLCLETELISASRALVSNVSQPSTLMIVNMGAGTTDFSILKEGILLFTRSIATGGNALTRALRQNLQLEEGQAEEYKKTYGLEENMLEGKVAGVLKPLVDSIIAEMRKGIAFYKERFPNGKIDTILLSGGTSLMPGIVSYLARELEIETQIGNPFSLIDLNTTQKSAKNFSLSESPIYTVAIGLALRETV